MDHGTFTAFEARIWAQTPIADASRAAAAKLGAVQSDMPGLWNAPGYPELTTWQMIEVAKLGPADFTALLSPTSSR